MGKRRSISQSPDTRKIVLRIKPTNSEESDGDDDYDEVEVGPSSRKKSKSMSNLKKKSNVKKKKAGDGDKPKKPPTAFFYYLEDFRKGYQEENPNVKSMRDIGKACGEKWKTMTYEEKVKYYDIATEKRAEFEKAMADYLRRKERGDDATREDSDSEFDGE